MVENWVEISMQPEVGLDNKKHFPKIVKITPSTPLHSIDTLLQILLVAEKQWLTDQEYKNRVVPALDSVIDKAIGPKVLFQWAWAGICFSAVALSGLNTLASWVNHEEPIIAISSAAVMALFVTLGCLVLTDIETQRETEFNKLPTNRKRIVLGGMNGEINKVINMKLRKGGLG